jgi:hypothetical protein
MPKMECTCEKCGKKEMMEVKEKQTKKEKVEKVCVACWDKMFLESSELMFAEV